MNEFIKKLLEKLEKLKQNYTEDCGTRIRAKLCQEAGECGQCSVIQAIEIVNQLAKEHNNGWIPCSERLPEAEKEVLILAKRKWKDGTFKYIITNAMYEDGTVSEYDSIWIWEDIEGEWDEENDCCIIPKGWWENKHYNPDGALNYAVDDEVLAWQPLPQAVAFEKAV